MNSFDDFDFPASDFQTNDIHQFAVDLVNTINDQAIFSDDVKFKVVGVEEDSFSGGLYISLSTNDLVEVPRKATWTCETEYEACDDPDYNADYEDSIYNDTAHAFKTLTATVDGNSVELAVDDVDEEDTISVEVHNTSREDDGIGSYEFWGDTGYDSDPYIQVEGVINRLCSVSLSLLVTPV